MAISGEMKDRDRDDMTLFLRRFAANWYWILVCAAMGLAAALMYLRYTAPVYKVRAKLLINDEKKGGGIAGQDNLIDLGSLLRTRSSVDNEAEVLRTRSLMEKTVAETAANITYYRKGRIRDGEIYHSPFSVIVKHTLDTILTRTFDLVPAGEDSVRITDGEFSIQVPFDSAFTLDGIGTVAIHRNPEHAFVHDSYRFRMASIDAQVADYMKRLSVKVTNKQVTTIDLEFETAIPEKGEYMLGTLIQQYVQGNLDDRNTAADSTIAFIENRLLLVSRELGAVENEIQLFRQQNRLANPPEQSKLLMSSAGDYDTQLFEAEEQLNRTKSLAAMLENSGTEKIAPAAVSPQDPVFLQLLEQYNGLWQERARLLLSMTEENPAIGNLDKRIARLRQDMRNNLAASLRQLNAAREGLRRKAGQIEGAVVNVPANERVYLDLARQQEIKQELFVFLLQKREETAISKTANIANSRIIDPPKSGHHPVSPRRLFVLMIGLLAGTALPLGIIYLMEAFNTRVTRKTDITSRTQVPVIAEIGNSTYGKIVLMNGGSRSPVAEQLRTLRTNLSFFLEEGDKTILLTSSMSGEGKSFIAVNLAAALAIVGKKVLIMELDLRKPKVTAKLELENKLGITSYMITPDMKPEEIIRPSGVLDNMFLVSSGPIPPNPAEIILHDRMDGLMDAMKARFDYIIIDAPPIGLVTDAQLLGKYADLTLFLVRHRYTFKYQLSLADDLCRGGKMRNTALLVNDIRKGGGYDGSGYYGNGYGYYTEETPSSWFRWIFKRKS
ncbi:tyrosine-protein kinase [Chitinophaga sp. XS-30]|uniref:GumC family protein n=1 Tax=Chitinophaga sp. XS-30 TaxID=2604421 RepID=UPI0011DCC691|nr:tyrosine-protein kinase [Chitinophaga sp. XS-30]QEH41861.1 polysaccharide biosynthesis tyrosine autokinase [Chitinophaga sp. XS-30]